MPRVRAQVQGASFVSDVYGRETMFNFQAGRMDGFFLLWSPHGWAWVPVAACVPEPHERVPEGWPPQ